MDRMSDSGSDDTSSNPVGVTKQNKEREQRGNLFALELLLALFL